MNYYPYYQLPQNGANNQVNSGIIWVSGEAGAKSYLVAPNSTVTLWDSESKTIYIKSADASGMPSIRTLEYTEREEKKPENASYATREDVSLLSKQINDIKAQIEAIREVKHESITVDANGNKLTK